ncbi:hypothetical protein JQ615_01190 [Bradyrhizobium jicamae]|uniref:Uncharacterized protein n=1 Tax=Bradyrhizobium jicamae TaxID=280332 RepID=A0ABS5FCB3_9BRAD|nr:hypothetical protein [Bradyrhizobium jicamae]MBR0793996.1 hypothetical protein [Bradyrhizobium jicamae]
MATVAQHKFFIEFQDVDTAAAGTLAEELREYLLSADPAVSAERRRADQSSMDFGATLILLLGAPAAVAVAKGIEVFLARYQSAAIRITGADGSIIVENLTSRQASNLALKLSKATAVP